MTTPSPDAAAPFKVVAFSGSLRAASSNTGLLKLAIRLLDELAPGATEVEVIDWLDELPYYNEDLEMDVPASVRRFRDVIGGADALLMAMPEYNYGPSAVAKNAVDWASRPFGASSLRGKVIALLTSASKGGGVNVQNGLTPVLSFFGNTVVEQPPVTIAMGFQRIGADGVTEDAEIVDVVREKMANVLTALRER